MKKCHSVGFGFDSHSFSEAGSLVLGGITIPELPALKGHSDGDALLHAVIDSLLGGAGLEDIGELFPDTSLKYRGISSLKLLRDVVKRVKKVGASLHHLDVTVVAEKPSISKIKSAIKKVLANELQVSEKGISIKGKRPEGLTLFSPPGGILVWAVSTLKY